MFEVDPRIDPTLQSCMWAEQAKRCCLSIQQVTITFFSDFIGSGRGFNISYEFTTDVDTCDSINTYPCGNRKCVPRRFLCDGKDDCGDGTVNRKFTVDGMS